MSPNPIQEATRIQGQAASPATSVALRASAGSGKTRVLVDRFIRLCVEDSPAVAHPRSILAITFTRRAAVEIQERLLARAMALALAEPADLDSRLRELFASRPDPTPTSPEKKRAAGLYELLLEDLSALNVGTIHSFCQTVLGRFAVEAGLDPQFSVLENSEDLQDEALDRLELDLAKPDQIRLHKSAAVLSLTPDSLRRTLTGFFYEQMRLERWLDKVAPATDSSSTIRRRSDLLPALLADLRTALFPDKVTTESLAAADLLDDLAVALEMFVTQGLNAVKQNLGADYESRLDKNCDKLAQAGDAVLPALRDPANGHRAEKLIADVRTIFLTKQNKPRAYTSLRNNDDLKAAFINEVLNQATPVLCLLRQAEYLDLYAQNAARLELGLHLLDIYDDLKRRDRVVDFQDLEDLARRLLGDSDQALSLLYRLDDSINHILLDEFQDTNFNQHDLLAPFVSEFLSGGDEARRRTVFFVGDVKQSIYGFRGAEPRIFSQVCRDLQDRGEPVLNLPTNFRSLEAIVGGVGCLFNAPPLATALEPEERDHVRQFWARQDEAGTVVALEPYTEAESDPDQPDDSSDERNADQLAAHAAAGLTLKLVADGVTWGDILVLSRTRTAISVYEKAFRDAGIPIVPSGRGMLAASREVQDILALLQWLSYPDDDVALATILRSPIFLVSEPDLQNLLALRGLQRPGSADRLRTPDGLWQTLRRLDDDPKIGSIVRILKGWRRQLDFANCHDLLRQIFAQQMILQRYQQTLGDQARYNLLRLYDLALSAEVAVTPTIRRLVEVIQRAANLGSQEEGVLPQTSSGGRVRFMTVHGAKGLEAPIVLLVDADRESGKDDLRVSLDPADSCSAFVLGVKSELRHGWDLPVGFELPPDPLQIAGAYAAQRARAEDANLLYVAMTRARNQLYVLGGDKGSKAKSESHLRQILQGAAAGPCPQIQTEDPAWLDRPPLVPPAAHLGDDTGDPPQPWQRPKLVERYRIQTPSAVASATDSDLRPDLQSAPQPVAASANEAAQRLAATERGQRIHLWLQQAADSGHMPPGQGIEHEEAAAVFANPDLAWVFNEGPDHRGLSEVSLIQRLPAQTTRQIESRVTGIIDRLVLRPGRADIVDYKTNRTGGDHQRLENWKVHYQPQLALYAQAIKALYPERQVHAWLLFTEPVDGAPAGRLEKVV